VAERVAFETSVCVKEKLFPLIVGGDHSLAIGTWSGIISTLKAEGKFGLIWLDAHMDSHTFKTTPSNAIHGMPLACLLGKPVGGLEDLMNKCPKLNPKHVVLIGARSYEEEEESFLKQAGVKIFYMDEIKKRGLKEIMKEALALVTHQTVGFGVSFDLDVYDSEVAPGVGSPEPDGLKAEETLAALEILRKSPSLLGIEVVEYNPSRDQDLKTLTLLKQTLLHLIPFNLTEEDNEPYRERTILFGT